MSKLAIFLCAALCSSAVDGFLVSALLVSTQQLVELKITVAEGYYRAAIQKATEFSEKLETAAYSLNNTFIRRIGSFEETIKSYVDNLVGKVKNVDVTDCKKIIEDLHHHASAMMTEMIGCIDNIKKTGLEYINIIDMESRNVLEILSAIRKEASHCGEKFYWSFPGIRAIACTKIAAIGGAFDAGRSGRAVTVNIGKITRLLSTFDTLVTDCMSTHGHSRSGDKFSTIVRKTKICIGNKEDEARRATPKVEYTTKKVDCTEAAPTTASATKKVDPTEAAPTTASATKKVDPTEAAPTTASATKKVDPTEAAVTPITERSRKFGKPVLAGDSDRFEEWGSSETLPMVAVQK